MQDPQHPTGQQKFFLGRHVSAHTRFEQICECLGLLAGHLHELPSAPQSSAPFRAPHLPSDPTRFLTSIEIDPPDRTGLCDLECAGRQRTLYVQYRWSDCGRCCHLPEIGQTVRCRDVRKIFAVLDQRHRGVTDGISVCSAISAEADFDHTNTAWSESSRLDPSSVPALFLHRFVLNSPELGRRSDFG
jgi:hypothetical protein